MNNEEAINPCPKQASIEGPKVLLSLTRLTPKVGGIYGHQTFVCSWIYNLGVKDTFLFKKVFFMVLL